MSMLNEREVNEHFKASAFLDRRGLPPGAEPTFAEMITDPHDMGPSMSGRDGRRVSAVRWMFTERGMSPRTAHFAYSEREGWVYMGDVVMS